MTLGQAGEILLRLSSAAIAGGLIGWNRERQDKPAGLRTHMLVSLGAASFTVILFDLLQRYPGQSGDPTRIIQGIATGIGFLGAGSIIREGGSVRGITTAAGIWVVGAVGVACGAGSYYVAAVTVALALLILTLARRIERHMHRQDHARPGS